MCRYNGSNKNYVDNISVLSTKLETEDRYNTTQHITTTKQLNNCNNYVTDHKTVGGKP